MSVKRSFSSERGGSSGGQEGGGNAHLPGFLQMLLCHQNQGLGSRIRHYPRSSAPRSISSSKPFPDKDTLTSLDFQSTHIRTPHTQTTDLLPTDPKRTPTVPRSCSVARRRPDHAEARERSLGGNTPLRGTVVKPLDINWSVRRVQDLIKAAPGVLADAGERSPPRFRPPKTSLRRPFHTSPENRNKYLPARHVPVDSVPHTSRPPEVHCLFQPSACNCYSVDLKVLQENTVGKLQREMELRKLAETIFADSKGSSILRKTHSRVKEDRENEGLKTVTFEV